jgi:hypothetical protein
MNVLVYLTSQRSALRHFFLSLVHNLHTSTFFCLRKYTMTVSDPLRVVKKLEIVLVLPEIKTKCKFCNKGIVYCLRKYTMTVSEALKVVKTLEIL